MNKKGLIITLLISLVLGACTSKESIFDPTIIQKESRETFPVKNVDSNHDWNLFSSYSVSISLNQKTQENYTVKVFTSNPFNKDTDAKLIAQKTGVKDGTTTTLNIEAAKALKYIYVVLEDSKYNRSMKSVELTSSSLSLSWSSEAPKTGATSRAFAISSSRSITSEGITFPTEIPAGATNYVGTDYIKFNESGATTFYIDGTGSAVTINSLEYNAGNVKSLYIKGNVTIGASGISDKYNVYILPGANVNFTQASNLLPNSSLYIADKATVTFGTDFLVQGKLYNHGTINGQMLTNSNIFYNIGIVNAVKYYSYEGKTENEGKMVLSALDIASGATIENLSGGDIKVNGETFFTNTIPFVNSGRFETNTLRTHASIKVINNCKFFVLNGGLILSGAEININGEGYMYLKGISEFNNSTIRLGEKSLLVIDSSLDFVGGNNTIIGPSGSERALVYLNGDFTTTGNKNWRLLTLTGNVDRAYLNGMTATEISDENGASSVDFTNVVLGEESECSRSFSLDGGQPQVLPVALYTYAFEDMFKEAGDYDFNDAVVQVSAVPVNNKVTVKLVAAGATKELYVYYKYNNGAETALFGGKEVHEAFGAPQSSMVNTKTANYAAVVEEITVPADFSIEKMDLYIKAKGEAGEIHIPAFTTSFKKGDVPYAILVPVDWSFPAESQSVTEKYPSFEEWAKDATKSLNWYE